MSRERSAVGRPLDEVWKHVEKLGNGKWKCNYCDRVFKGSASRIRNHLSDQGNDISACKDMPEGIREEVLRQKTQKKRRLEEDNDVGNIVIGQEMMGDTSSRVVASDSITPPLQVVLSSPVVAHQQVSSMNVDVAEGSLGMGNCLQDRSVSFLDNVTGEEWDISSLLNLAFPSSSNNRLMNTTSAIAREEAVTDRMDMDVSDALAVGSNNHLSSAGVVAREEPVTERMDTNVNDALAAVGLDTHLSTAGAPAREEPVTERITATNVNDAFAGREEPATKTGYTDVDPLVVGMASVSITTRSREEYVTDAFMKFLMCNKFSSVDSDLLKDPYFKEYLERAHQYGVPSSLHRGDSLVIEKSLFNIRREVRQHMLVAKESWKTRGSTLITFNLNHENKGRLSTLEKDRYIYGFYCPKGFIFVEAPDPSINIPDFKDAMKRHSLSLDIDDVTHVIYHHDYTSHGLDDYHLCELSDYMKYIVPNHIDVTSKLPCLRHELQGVCINICRTSSWAQSLVNKAVKIHECLCCHVRLRYWYLKLLTEKGERRVLEDSNAMDASRLSVFFSIMLLEHDLIDKLPNHKILKQFGLDPAQVQAMLDDSKFWADGRILKQVLTRILRISDLMDTLVPAVGYLALAIDKVKHTIFKHYGETLEEDTIFMFWQELESMLSDINKDSWGAASYLNPVYFLQQHVQKHPDLHEVVMQVLDDAVFIYDKFGLYEEVERYGEVFNNLQSTDIRLEDYHPVKLWEKYGHDLPLLRKYAVIFLSQPVSCLCNQVKKHMYQLEGADDYILRLNVRMMEEFKILGDDIYKPIDLSELEVDDWVFDTEEMSRRSYFSWPFAQRW